MESENISYHETIDRLKTDPAFVIDFRKKSFGVWHASLGDNPKVHFRQVIPQEEIDSWLAIETPLIRDCFQEGEIDRIQMVGSTSVPGMCGMMAPDFGIFVNVFPPAQKTFSNLKTLGYELQGFFKQTGESFDDIWLFKKIPQAGSENTGLGACIHIWEQGSAQAKSLIGFRDQMRSDKSAFDIYRNKKLELMKNDNISRDEFIKYKRDKGKVAKQQMENQAALDKASKQ